MDEKLIKKDDIEDILQIGTSEKLSLFQDRENQREQVVLFHVFNPNTGSYEKEFLSKTIK
jgi:hypothetical protein